MKYIGQDKKVNDQISRKSTIAKKDINVDYSEDPTLTNMYVEKQWTYNPKRLKLLRELGHEQSGDWDRKNKQFEESKQKQV